MYVYEVDAFFEEARAGGVEAGLIISQVYISVRFPLPTLQRRLSENGVGFHAIRDIVYALFAEQTKKKKEEKHF